MGVGLVIRGDEIWQFGTGFRTTHGDVEGRKQKTDGATFRYVQRVDGFVSLDFSSAGGSGWTAPLAVDGSALFLNLDTGAMGNLRVGLCDQTGREIPGFGVYDCDVLKVNSTRAVVTWHGHQDTSALRGQKVQVAFRGARTKLYSLRFE
jgi:hypothetical protein